MSDKKISDLPSGLSLHTGDKIFVTRGDQNVYVTGSDLPILQDFVPPSSRLFPQGSWGNGATGPLAVSDHPRGLLIADNSADTTGFKFASRTIPAAMQSLFQFTVRISYNGLTKPSSGVGVGFSTASTGPGGRAFFTTRYFDNNRHVRYGGVWNPNANTPYYDVSGGTYTKGWEFRWFRGIVVGTVAQLFTSEDGVNFILFGEYDFGSPVTSYGLVMQHGSAGANAALCDYFDSTEVQQDPKIRITGTIIPPTIATGVTAPHKCWRLRITENYGGATTGLSGMQMRPTPGNTTLNPVDPAGNPTNGGMAIASENVSTAGRAFSYGSSTYQGWQTSSGPTGWVGYSFLYPVSVQEITYQQFVNPSAGMDPKTVVIEYSDDCTNWTAARTVTNLPRTAYHTDNSILVNPAQSIVTAPNSKAKSGSVTKVGAKAAYSTRRLYDDYNGPLYQIEAAGGSFDVYAGTDGYADTTVAFGASNGQDVTVSKWYDQTGNGFHATPMTDAQADRFSGYRPRVAINGALVKDLGGKPALYFNGSPLDILGVNFLATPCYVYAGVELDNLSVAQIFSASTTLGDSAALAILPDGNVGAARNENAYVSTPNQSAGPPVSVGPRRFGYVTSTIGFGDTIQAFTAQVNFNDPHFGGGYRINNYGQGDSSLMGNRSRIGGAVWQVHPNDAFNRNTINGGRIRELFIYEAGKIDPVVLYNSILGLPNPKPKPPIDFYPPISPDVDDGKQGQRTFNVVSTSNMAQNVYKWTVPNYENSISFETFGGGASSGESAYDGTVIRSKHDAPGVNGPPGVGSAVVGPDGSYTLTPNYVWQNSGGNSLIPVDPSYSNARVIAGPGQGGLGWQGVALRGSPAGPPVSTRRGTDAVGSIRDLSAGDVTTTGGGAPGGPPTPYFGNTISMGGQGGNGGYAKKTYQKSDAGAPKPGEVWTIIAGPGGQFGPHYGAATAGQNGRVIVNWN